MRNDEEIFLKLIGNNIRNIRKNQGLSMETVANDAEIEYRQLGRIERGEGNSTIITLKKIATAMNVEMSQFFISHSPDSN
jgi:transcriptional regulator with XRE-family HTH domain